MLAQRHWRGSVGKEEANKNVFSIKMRAENFHGFMQMMHRAGDMLVLMHCSQDISIRAAEINLLRQKKPVSDYNCIHS